MRGIQSNSSKLVKSVSKHKLLLFIFIAACAIALALPATLSFASENAQDNNPVAEENYLTISGRITKAGEPSVGLAGAVQIFGVKENIQDA